MDRSNLASYLEENEGLIHAAARMGYGRLQALGAQMDYDDLVQEMTELFIVAYDKFDESNGAPFSSYFMFSARNKINKIGERMELERCGTMVVAVEKDSNGRVVEVKRKSIHAGTLGIEEINAKASDNGHSFEETLASDMATPEEIVEATSVVASMMKQLSPLAAQMMEMTLNPPEFIEREFDAIAAHAEFARSMGIERRSRTELNLSFVAGILEKTSGLPIKKIRAARSEIADLAKRSF